MELSRRQRSERWAGPMCQAFVLSNAIFIDASAIRNALSLFRCNVCCEVPGENFA